jgi:hypothetical protein
MTEESPIQNLDAIDVVGARDDGGVDLVIVAAAPIDGSSDTLSRLDRKLRGYLAEARSECLRRRFPEAPPGSVRVLVVCEHAVDGAAQRLIHAYGEEAASGGIAVELVAEIV